MKITRWPSARRTTATPSTPTCGSAPTGTSFSGAFGHTYGNHSVWQMYAPQRKPINGPLLYWNEAIHRPGAAQMQYVRALIESRPFLSRVPDQSIVANALEGADHIAATRGDGYLFVYSAQGRPFTVNMGKISGDRVKGWWYNPRSGISMEAGFFRQSRHPRIHAAFPGLRQRLGAGAGRRRQRISQHPESELAERIRYSRTCAAASLEILFHVQPQD